MFFTIYVLVLIFSLSVKSEDYHTSCITKDTCGACISTPGCVWCSLPIHKNELEERMHMRCRHIDNKSVWCPENHLINPKTNYSLIMNSPLKSGSHATDHVQISPQHIRASLRVGEEITIPIKYQQAEDYPVDLYFLMDLSASMSDDKDKLSLLGGKLVDAMKAITSNFRIGFGSFVDKVEMPFTITYPNQLQNPCIPMHSVCNPPYSYKNQLPLTSNTELFSIEVDKVPISGNFDAPEGGFDALMQVIVCQDKIGWREKSRKLIVFATDAETHIAGDGKLAGIVEPNDRLCHLDSNGSYTHDLLLDYPSIAMLDAKARENNINIIFASNENVKIYKVLKDSIYGASHGALSKDSSNVVDLVKAEYDKIVNKVALSDNAGGSIKIQYLSKCPGDVEKQTNECGNLKGRPELEFKAVIKAVNCPENKNKWKQVININPGTLNETLKLEVEIICQCECEKDVQEQKAKECNEGGSLQCGVCACDSGRYGKFCECDGNEVSTDARQGGCKADNSTEEVCSGLGFCKCGKCECNQRSNPEERIYGTYCECDNYSCKRSGGLICSGPEKGRCDCGECVCESGWSGSACECRDNNVTCIAPDSNEICSGHGACECGSCQCTMTEKFRYSGQYCEECPHCTDTKCNQLRDCVECQVHKSGIYSENECSLKCTSFQSEIVDKIQIEQENEILAERICRVPDSSGCTIVFKYKYEEDNVSFKVYALRIKECAADIDVLAVVFGVMGSILLASLCLLIVWKIVTTVHDRREFAKFENERKNAKWGTEDNPVYKPSTTVYWNPMFRRSKN